MVAKFKAIKAKPFRRDQFKIAMRPRATRLKQNFQVDFGRGVKDWDHDVKWTAKVQWPAGKMIIFCDTDDEIYTFVHEGTEEHDIVGNPTLMFQEGYSAKTEPGIIDSRAGGPFGDFVHVDFVKHPGTKGRFFAVELKKIWEQPFYNEVKAALAEAALRSGHKF